MDDSSTIKIQYIKKGERKGGDITLNRPSNYVSVKELINESNSTNKRKKKSKKITNYNKLRFKRSVSNHEPKNDLVKPLTESDSEDDCYSQSQYFKQQPISTNSPKTDPSSNKKPKTKKELLNAVNEFGPDINGYRFVSLNSKEDPEISKMNFSKHTAKPNIFYPYNERIPAIVNPIDDPYRSKIGHDDLVEQEFSYDYEKYCKLWKLLKEGNKVNEIPLPVFGNSVQNIELEKVKQFLKTNSNIKKERIRWHPDQMMNRLKAVDFCGLNPSEAKVIVTQVFQIVNEIHEIQKI